jgi:hypothetical protein
MWVMDDRDLPPSAAVGRQGRLRWRWNRGVTGLVVGGLAFTGLGTYFLAGDSPVYTVVWIGFGVVMVARPIVRAGLRD